MSKKELKDPEYDLRPLLTMEQQGKLYVNPDVIPKDVDYYWVRISIMDKPDTSRMVEMKRKGWTPVPSERHPDLVFTDFFGALDRYQGVIYSDGLLLCERPKQYGKAERHMQEKANYERMVSMPGTENFLGEPNIPSRFTGDTYMTKNASFAK